MMETPSKAVVTKWLLDLITGQLSGDQKAGDGKAEPSRNGDGKVIYPYWIVYSIPGGYVTGPALGQAQGDARLVYQVDSIGRSRAQAEMAGDRARNWVAGRTPSGVFVVTATDPDGHRIHDRIVDGTLGAPLQEGLPPNEVFTVSDTFGIDVSVT